MSLDILKENQTAIIVGFNNLDKNLLKRLYDIGLRINSQITVIKKNKRGVMLISIYGRLIALSFELVSKVLVRV